MIIQAFLDATCRRRDKHAETLRDYQITALVQYICIYGDIQYKEVTKSVYQLKKNAYEGELSLVANEVKRKKKKLCSSKKGKIGRDGSSRLKGNCNLCSQSFFTISYGEDNIILNNLILIVKLLIYIYKMSDEDPSFNVFLVKRQAHLKY